MVQYGFTYLVVVIPGNVIYISLRYWMPETAWYLITKFVIYTSIFNQNTYVIRLEQMN